MVTDLTNVMAVCVALFLPIYQEKKGKKAAKKRIKIMATNIVDKILSMIKDNPDEDITKSKIFETYRLLIAISAVTDGDTVNISILIQIQNLLMDHKKYSTNDLEVKIQNLLSEF